MRAWRFDQNKKRTLEIVRPPRRVKRLVL